MKINQLLFAALIIGASAIYGCEKSENMDNLPKNQNFLANFTNNEGEFNRQLSMLNPSNPSERAHIENFLKDIDPKIETTRTWLSENPSSSSRISRILRLRAFGLLSYGCGLSFIPTIFGACRHLEKKEIPLTDLYHYGHRYQFGPTRYDSLWVPYKLIVPAVPLGIGLGYHLFKKAKPEASIERTIRENLDKLKSLVTYRNTAAAALQSPHKFPKIKNRWIESAMLVGAGTTWLAIAKMICEPNKKSDSSSKLLTDTLFTGE